ncbi:hypothetical protein ABZT28_10560, partial [Streptomyces sp. NPDC005388]
FLDNIAVMWTLLAFCLAADPALRAAYGAAGRATVEGRTWAAVGDQLIDHYADVLSARTVVAA